MSEEKNCPPPKEVSIVRVQMRNTKRISYKNYMTLYLLRRAGVPAEAPVVL
jgi:hypothetical protein